MLSNQADNNTKWFTRENLDLYLRELAKAYKKENGRYANAEIVLIGGAAILAGYDFREVTTDVDAEIRARASMKSAINLVGDMYGLPNGWLNSDFTKTSSYSPKLAEYSKHYRTFSGILNVRVISGEHLVAMKLRSFREYKHDRSDIIGVLAYHENIGMSLSFEGIKKATIDLYGSWDSVSNEAKTFIEAALLTKDLQALFENIVREESEAKELLVDFEAKYKDVLNSDNLNDILLTLRAKCQEQDEMER